MGQKWNPRSRMIDKDGFKWNRLKSLAELPDGEPVLVYDPSWGYPIVVERVEGEGVYELGYKLGHVSTNTEVIDENSLKDVEFWARVPEAPK